MRFGAAAVADIPIESCEIDSVTSRRRLKASDQRIVHHGIVFESSKFVRRRELLAVKQVTVHLSLSSTSDVSTSIQTNFTAQFAVAVGSALANLPTGISLPVAEIAALHAAINTSSTANFVYETTFTIIVEASVNATSALVAQLSNASMLFTLLRNSGANVSGMIVLVAPSVTVTRFVPPVPDRVIPEDHTMLKVVIGSVGGILFVLLLYVMFNLYQARRRARIGQSRTKTLEAIRAKKRARTRKYTRRKPSDGTISIELSGIGVSGPSLDARLASAHLRHEAAATRQWETVERATDRSNAQEDQVDNTTEDAQGEQKDLLGSEDDIKLDSVEFERGEDCIDLQDEVQNDKSKL